MRKGIYWLNLMTEDEMGKWCIDCITLLKFSPFSPIDVTRDWSYRNFEEFIRGTVLVDTTFFFPSLSKYWRDIIKKYEHDKLSPRKHNIKKHLL